MLARLKKPNNQKKANNTFQPQRANHKLTLKLFFSEKEVKNKQHTRK